MVRVLDIYKNLSLAYYSHWPKDMLLCQSSSAKSWLVLSEAFLCLLWDWSIVSFSGGYGLGGAHCSPPPHSHRDTETWKVAIPHGAGGNLSCLGAASPVQISPQVPSWAVPWGDPHMWSCRDQEISLVVFRPHHWSILKHPHHPSCRFRDVVCGCDWIGYK